MPFPSFIKNRRIYRPFLLYLPQYTTPVSPTQPSAPYTVKNQHPSTISCDSLSIVVK
ncbi:hypothetical protein HMPREF3033_01008 [Veillonellaceae bacterium DNF00751]|nr:hypothetical protein HMPREF3033_01008 [Veillonellaceae bacterium DNF00751]